MASKEVRICVFHEPCWILIPSSSVLLAPQVSDIYSTGEPQSAFHARIAFCLDLHNEAVKAMRYEVR